MLGQFARVLSPISGFLACWQAISCEASELRRFLLALTLLLSLLLASLLLLLLLEPALWDVKEIFSPR
jgi:hypothetical protein